MTEARMQSSSAAGRLQLVEVCGRCDLWPCACAYIRRLRPTGDLATFVNSRSRARGCRSLTARPVRARRATQCGSVHGMGRSDP